MVKVGCFYYLLVLKMIWDSEGEEVVKVGIPLRRGYSLSRRESTSSR